MQFDLTKNLNSPLKIFIYRDKINSLVANLAYSVDESIKNLSLQENTFYFLGTIDAIEVINKIKKEEPTPEKKKEISKAQFIFGLMYAVDNFVVDSEEQKLVKGILNKITLK